MHLLWNPGTRGPQLASAFPLGEGRGYLIEFAEPVFEPQVDAFCGLRLDEKFLSLLKLPFTERALGLAGVKSSASREAMRIESLQRALGV